MPAASATIEIQAAPEAVFEVIHDYSRRLEWDPFLREAKLLNGALNAGLGVASRCTARWATGGQAMETVYVSFKPPHVAAVKMTRGPWFLAAFAATLRHDRLDAEKTRVTYRYNFNSQPTWLRFMLDPLIQAIFHRETCRRLVALKTYMEVGQD